MDWCLHHSVNCRPVATNVTHTVMIFIMEWTALCCALIATFLTMLAEPVISSPQSYIPPEPEPAAVFNSGKAVTGEALQQLHDYMKQGNSHLHDRLKESFKTLRELVKEGDGNVQDRLLQGLAQSKEQLRDRDDQLKEELDDDVAWLKDQLTKGQRRWNEELAEEEARREEDLREQKENLEKLRSTVKKWPVSSSAVVDDLRTRMTDFQAELKSIKQQLQATPTELETCQRNLQRMQEIVRSSQPSQSIQDDLNAPREKVNGSQEELEKPSDQLSHQEQAFTAVQTQLLDEVRSLKVKVDNLQSSHDLLTSSELGKCVSRPALTRCDIDNASLVYSEIANGALDCYVGSVKCNEGHLYTKDDVLFRCGQQEMGECRRYLWSGNENRIDRTYYLPRVPIPGWSVCVTGTISSLTKAFINFHVDNRVLLFHFAIWMTGSQRMEQRVGINEREVNEHGQLQWGHHEDYFPRPYPFAVGQEFTVKIVALDEHTLKYYVNDTPLASRNIQRSIREATYVQIGGHVDVSQINLWCL